MYGKQQEDANQIRRSSLMMQVMMASSNQLVLILFDELADELVRAKSHIVSRRYELKAQSINQCVDILDALTSVLDCKKGGEIAINLVRIYDYCGHRLFEASNQLSVELIAEVETLLSNLRKGWQHLAQRDLPHE